MKHIRINALIASNDPDKFSESLTKGIDNMQDRGFEVEIQFNTRSGKSVQIINDSYTLTMLAGFLLGWLACVLVRNSRNK